MTCFGGKKMVLGEEEKCTHTSKRKDIFQEKVKSHNPEVDMEAILKSYTSQRRVKRQETDQEQVHN